MCEVGQRFSKRLKNNNFHGYMSNNEAISQIFGVVLTLIAAVSLIYFEVMKKLVPGEMGLLALLIIYIFFLGRFRWGYANYLSVGISLLYYTVIYFIDNVESIYNLFYAIMFLSIIFGVEKLKTKYMSINTIAKDGSELYFKILNSFKDRIAIIDSNGDFIYLNSAWEYLNESHREFLPFKIEKGVNGKKLLREIKNNTGKEILKIFNNVAAGAEDDVIYEYSIEVNGSRRWFKIIIGQIPNESGKFFVTHFEITKRKSAELGLIESKKRYRRLLESIPDAVLLHINGEIMYANASALDFLGLKDKKEIRGKNIIDFIYEDYKDEARARIVRIQRKSEKMPLMECKITRFDGKAMDVEVSEIGYLYDNKPASLMVIRDITERKQTEKLKRDFEEKRILLDKAYEYDRIKNEFFANISHELRTPLNVILSAIQVMMLSLNKEGIMDIKKLRNYTGMIRQNCYRLLRLVNNIIDLSKIDAGFYEIHPQNQNIVSIVEDITQSVVEYAREKSIDIEFDTDTEEKIISCDPDKIERIILNLLSNSIKFTEPGGKIFVNIIDEGDNVKIILKDTGIGIPEDKINIIFERFRQASKSLIKNNQGSGIGLSLVKSLVELHNGKINVKSRKNEGSEFIIELPVGFAEGNLYEDINVMENNLEQSKIERISIEFSDIYSNHQ